MLLARKPCDLWYPGKSYDTASEVRDGLQELRDKMLGIDDAAVEAIERAIAETEAAMDRLE
jgi:hypothetical protein